MVVKEENTIKVLINITNTILAKILAVCLRRIYKIYFLYFTSIIKLMKNCKFENVHNLLVITDNLFQDTKSKVFSSLVERKRKRVMILRDLRYEFDR